MLLKAIKNTTGIIIRMVGSNNYHKFLTSAFATVALALSSMSFASSKAPEFIPSTCLNLSPVSAFVKATQPKKTSELKRQRMDAIIDIENGCLIGDIDQNLDTPTDPASLTKLATAIVIFDFLRKGQDAKGNPLSLNTKIANIAGWKGQNWSTKRNKTIPWTSDLRNDDMNVEDGLKYMLGLSVNQMGRSLAMTMMGDFPETRKAQIQVEKKFMRLVNNRMRELGLDSTHFINSNGLPGRDRNYRDDRTIAPYSNTTDLRDLSKLAITIAKKYPEFKQYSTKTYQVSKDSDRIRIQRYKDKLREQGEPVKKLSKEDIQKIVRDPFNSTNPLYKEDYIGFTKRIKNMVSKTGTTNDAGRTIIVTVMMHDFNLGVITHGHDNHYLLQDKTRPEKVMELLKKGKKLLQEEQEQQIILNLF